MRVRGSVVAAAILALGVTGWIISGQFDPIPAKPAGKPDAGQATNDTMPTRVRTRTITAETYVSVIRVTGQTEASRRISIRSRIDGRVQRLAVKQGEVVKQHEILAELDPEDMPARIAEARARVRQREIENAAAEKLANQGYQTETRRASTHANLQAAIAQLRRIETDLANTVFRAPFDSILNVRAVELGDVLQKGDVVGELIDLDPVLVSAYVSERDYLKLRKGQAAKARFTNGVVLDGRIRYVSAEAERSTRTFKVELEIPNPESLLIDGATAELVVPLQPVAAHRISAALFSLDASGKLGLKIVGADNTVVFVPVSILGGTEKEIFVAGLPESVTLIVVGQDFVVAGDIVEPVPEQTVPGASS